MLGRCLGGGTNHSVWFVREWEGCNRPLVDPFWNEVCALERIIVSGEFRAGRG